MNRSLKAALLSAFIFPGAGQLFLKRRGRACLFLLPSLVAAVYYFDQVMTRASAIAEQILAGKGPLDPAQLAAQLESDAPGSPLMTAAAVVMIVCWIASIVDACLIGRAQER